MLQWLSKMILKFWGFRIEGNIPLAIDKKIYVVVPHTSNWDFVLGMLVKAATGIKVNFLAKHSLFWGPVGWFMRSLGFLPVNRNQKSDLITQLIEIFANNDRVSIGLAPEGTRSQVKKLKTGFYHIAHGASVPLILVTFDLTHKRAHFGDPYFVTDDKKADLAYVEQYFAGVVGFNKKNSFKVNS